MTNPKQCSVYNDPVYRRSRWAYAIECMFEHFIYLLISGAFLAKLLGNLGMDDATIGVVSSLISFACLFQLLSVVVVQRIHNVKAFSILFHLLSNAMFMSLYLLPVLPGVQAYRQVLAFVCVIVAYFGKYLASSILFRWANSHVDPYHRAEFSAVKEMISLGGGMVVTLIVGRIIDGYEAANHLEGGFLFSAAAILIFALFDLICLLLVRNAPKQTTRAPSVPLREVLAGTIGNRNFRNVILLTVIWNMAQYCTTGFIGTYEINAGELAFSVGTVQLINIAGDLGRLLLSRPFGRYSDRTSFAHGMKLAFLIAAGAFGCVVVTTPTTRYLILGYAVLYAVSLAGIGQNMVNITYNYVEERFFVQAASIKECIGGVCGFATSLLAGRILDAVQTNGNTLFGIPIYGQQLLGLISVALLGGAILFTHFVIERQTVMKQ